MKKIFTPEMKENSTQVAEILKSMAHPQRLLVLCTLCEGEYTVNEILESSELSQSHLSQILNRLKLEGLIDSRKNGRNVYYFLKEARIRNLILELQKNFC